MKAQLIAALLLALATRCRVAAQDGDEITCKDRLGGKAVHHILYQEIKQEGKYAVVNMMDVPRNMCTLHDTKPFSGRIAPLHIPVSSQAHEHRQPEDTASQVTNMPLMPCPRFLFTFEALFG